MRVPAVWLLALLLALAPPAAAAPSVDGTWGVVDGGLSDGARPRCAGTAVMVLHRGAYYRVLPDVGTSQGRRDQVIARARYALRGTVLTVEPSLSYGQAAPRQTFDLQQVGGRALIRRGQPPLTFRPCPPLDPDRLAR